MRRLLAIDTSCWWGGVALAERDTGGAVETVAELGLVARDSHAAHLMGWIERLLELAGWPRSSLDGYVATRGPGSFTGLRIGLGTLRGLALAAGKPCGGVVTLDAMAEAAGPGAQVRAAVLDGGRGELFYGRYAPAGSPPERIGAPSVAPIAEALAACAADRIVAAPDGRTAEALRRAGLEVTPPVRGVAGAAAKLALLRPAAIFDPAELNPLYLRASDAELNLRRR